MECILHIGLEKTATTTLQDFLFSNRGPLLKQGVRYFRLGGGACVCESPLIGYDGRRRDEFTFFRGIDSERDLLSHQAKLIEVAREKMRLVEREEPVSSILLSSEHFQSRLTTEEEVGRLRCVLTGLGVDAFRVIVYLRDPADLAASMYSTSVRHGYLGECPPGPDDPYYRNVCDHRGTLQRVASVFSRSAIVPRIFDKREWAFGSIVRDFVRSLGLEWNGFDYDSERSLNGGLSEEALAAMRRLNRLGPRVGRERGRKVVRCIEAAFSRERYSMPDGLRRLYISRFEESNEWVRRNYFPDRSALFEHRESSGGKDSLGERAPDTGRAEIERWLDEMELEFGSPEREDLEKL